MKTTNFTIFAASLLLLSSCSNNQMADQKIEEWVKKNPDKILTALMEHQKKDQEKNSPNPELLKTHASAVFDQNAPTQGSGPIKIAYFFDFNCGHCVKQSSTIKSLFEKIPQKVQIIYHPMAVLGPSSELAARASFAAHKQGRFYDFYVKTLETREKSPESLKKIAKDLKLDVSKWESDLEGDETKKWMASKEELAANMKIRGTPFLAIAPDKVFPGRVDALQSIVEGM